MRSFFIVAILVIASNTFAQIDIGDTLTTNHEILDSLSLIMSSAGSLEKTYLIQYQDISYNICINKNRTIKSIFIKDKKFKTPDGLSVGMKYKSIKSKLLKCDYYEQKGWANYYILASGWKAAFSYKESIANSSRILFFFK